MKRHLGGEARMLLPGVQTFLGFPLMSVFDQRFKLFTRREQMLHYAAFLMVALTMGLMMAPAACHRQAEGDRISRRFVDMSSSMLSLAMLPFTAGVCLDTYLIGRIILGGERISSGLAAAALCVVLIGLWFAWATNSGPPATAMSARLDLEGAVHLRSTCSGFFAEPGPWFVAWLPLILPQVAELARRHPERTVLTPLHPAARTVRADGRLTGLLPALAAFDRDFRARRRAMQRERRHSRRLAAALSRALHPADRHRLDGRGVERLAVRRQP